jgi:hypothetical protein
VIFMAAVRYRSLVRGQPKGNLHSDVIRDR